MATRRRHLALALLISCAFPGCAFRMGDLSLVASENVAFAPDVKRKSVEAEDCVYTLLFIPLGGFVPNVEEAMDRAMEQVPEGNVMTNVAIYQDVIITYLFNQQCLRVKGDVGVLE